MYRDGSVPTDTAFCIMTSALAHVCSGHQHGRIRCGPAAAGQCIVCSGDIFCISWASYQWVLDIEKSAGNRRK